MQARFTSVYKKEGNMEKGGELSEFTTRKSVEFYKLNSISYRSEVVQTTDGRLYVALTRYWMSPQTGDWVPTKKQVFMPVAAWRNMKQAMSLIDDSLDEIMPRNTASKYGMFIIFPIYYLLLNYNLLAFYIEHIVYKESTLKIYLFSNLIF